MSSLHLRLAFAISIAASALPSNIYGQQANGYQDNSAQSNRRSHMSENVSQERLGYDFNTSPRTSSSARIKMMGAQEATDLRQNPQRAPQNNHPSPPVAPPVRFASYEADLTPNHNQIEVHQPPLGSVQADVTDDGNDLSGLRKALDTYRDQPNSVSPSSHGHQPYTQNTVTNTTVQHSASPDDGPVDEPATGKGNLKALGFSVSDDSRKFIERIAYNMLFVLTLGIGFIVVAKKWMKFGGAEIKQSKSEFEVLNTLNLPGKSSLMLVKVNNDRLLVAVDSTGVKSVVHLTDSHNANLDAYEDVAEKSPENQLQEIRSFADHLEQDLPPKSPEIRRKKPTKTRTPRTENTAAKNTEAIQKQMEAALLKFGLKGLV